MSEEFTANFAKLSPDAQRLTRIERLRCAAQQAGAKDPGTVANLVQHRSGEFVPTHEAVTAALSEFAVVHSELFSSPIHRNELQSAIDARDCERLARDAGAREENIRDVASHLQGAGNRLQALTELRAKRPDLFCSDNRPLSPQQIASLDPSEYRRLRREAPERLGLRR